jgi:hypothetical protein
LLVDDEAEVYLNGHLVINDHSRGVTQVTNLDVTSYLQTGPNLLAVKAHDSFGIFEGLYLSLRAGPHELVNPLVAFVDAPSTHVTDPHPAAGCPMDYAGTFHFEARLTNTSAPRLTGGEIEIERLSGGNVLLLNDGTELAGAGKAVDVVPQAEGYADGVLDSGERVHVPFTICLQQIAPFRFSVNVLAITDGELLPDAAVLQPLHSAACPGGEEPCH